MTASAFRPACDTTDRSFSRAYVGTAFVCGRYRWWSLALVLLAALIVWPIAAVADGTKPDDATTEATAPPETAAPSLSNLPAGQVVRIRCDTTALFMGGDAFNSSKGEITVRLRFDAVAKAGAPRDGKWFVDSVAADHARSFAALSQPLCEAGCVARLVSEEQPAEGQKQPRRQLELWAPGPLSIKELGEDGRLVLAAFKIPSLDLKVSMFEGRQPLGFEQGTCAMEHVKLD